MRPRLSCGCHVLLALPQCTHCSVLSVSDRRPMIALTRNKSVALSPCFFLFFVTQSHISAKKRSSTASELRAEKPVAKRTQLCESRSAPHHAPPAPERRGLRQFPRLHLVPYFFLVEFAGPSSQVSSSLFHQFSAVCVRVGDKVKYLRHVLCILIPLYKLPLYEQQPRYNSEILL